MYTTLDIILDYRSIFLISNKFQLHTKYVYPKFTSQNQIGLLLRKYFVIYSKFKEGISPVNYKIKKEKTFEGLRSATATPSPHSALQM